MSQVIFCQKLQKEAPKLDEQPYPGPLGEKVYTNISAEAWTGWLAHQTMLINEYRLSPIEPKTRPFLEEEMEKYFFGAGSDKPEGYNEKAE